MCVIYLAYTYHSSGWNTVYAGGLRVCHLALNFLIDERKNANVMIVIFVAVDIANSTR